MKYSVVHRIPSLAWSGRFAASRHDGAVRSAAIVELSFSLFRRIGGMVQETVGVA